MHLILHPLHPVTQNILAYEIDLPPSGNKTGLNFLDDEYFTVPYITNKTPNEPEGHQLPTQD